MNAAGPPDPPRQEHWDYSPWRPGQQAQGPSTTPPGNLYGVEPYRPGPPSYYQDMSRPVRRSGPRVGAIITIVIGALFTMGSLSGAIAGFQDSGVGYGIGYMLVPVGILLLGIFLLLRKR